MAKDKRRGEDINRSRKIGLRKTPTYINGLDEILNGGLPTKRTTLVVGEPGSGKTIMGMEFLYRGAGNGEPGIFLGFEEPSKIIRENAMTFGWDFLSLEKNQNLYLMEGRLSPEIIVEGKFSLKPLLSVISGKSKEIGAKRIVLDALDVILTLFEDPLQARSELYRLNEWLTRSGLTSILTLKPRESIFDRVYQDFFYSISDCVIYLDTKIHNQISTRRLRVVKYRGSSFGRNEYPFIISDEGIRTIPITKFELMHKAFEEKISSGIPELDTMLGGGFYRASCILFAGEPGTGKTLFVSTFAHNICSKGEKVFYLCFEESPEALLRNIKSAGIDLEQFLKEGTFKIIGSMPEATGAEEHLIRLIDFVDEMKPQHVIVDAISAVERMGGKQVSFDYLMRLLNFLKERGITTILTNQTTGTKTQIEISGNGISSMLDTVIFLSYVHGDGETNRTIQVLKSRGSKHSNQVREYLVKDDGINILDPYTGPGGVLTGTARKIQEAKDALEHRRREAEIQAKRREIERLNAEADTQNELMRQRIETVKAELAYLEFENEKAIAERNERARLRGGE